MISLPACTCDAAKHFEKHTQLIRLMQFLMGLDDTYVSIRSNILTRDPLPSVKTAFSVVSGEESHRNFSSGASTVKPNASTFASKNFDNKKRFNNNNHNNKCSSNTSGNNSNNRGPNPNLKCSNCNKIGHTVDRCFKLVGYPLGYVKRNFNANTKSVTSNNAYADVYNTTDNSTSNTHVSLSNEQLARLMSLLNDNNVSSANANMAGKSLKWNFVNGSVKFNLNFKKYFNGNTNFIIGNISLGWIVDSGANQHMTVSSKFLINIIDISNLGLTVGHPNGTQATITKIGDLKINNNITLYDVLVVLEYIVSLLSIYKLARDSKMFVGFDDNHCYIQDLKEKGNVGIGNQCNGLYVFNVDNACKIVSSNCTATCFVSKYLWHQRLGHPSDQVLNVLKNSLNLDSHSTSDHFYDTCNKAKQTREPFPLSA